MAAITTQSVSNGALTTPVPITPNAIDTIPRGQFGPNGVRLRIITTGTTTTLTVSDPNPTAMGNTGTPASLACPSSGSRETVVPLSAINSSDVATLNFSGALTGVTYEAYRI